MQIYLMKKILLASCLLLSLGNLLTAQNVANMNFDRREIDYGNVSQGSDGLRIFKFKNTGTSPLIIKNARPSCGCTVPNWPSEPIAPGQTATIEIKYDTNKLGTFNKTITVETNEPVGKHILTIKGNIYEKRFEASINQNSGSKK